MSAINMLRQYLQFRNNVLNDLFSNLIHMETLVKTSVSYTTAYSRVGNTAHGPVVIIDCHLKCNTKSL